MLMDEFNFKPSKCVPFSYSQCIFNYGWSFILLLVSNRHKEYVSIYVDVYPL